MSSELTRAELLSGHYRDKYGRLRNEKGQFVYESRDIEGNDSPEDVHEWYERLQKNREIVKVTQNVYICNNKIKPLLTDTQIEVICFIGIMTVAGLVVKIIQCIW